jgi:hypothetical protein
MLGDEWYEPLSNKLYKFNAVSGTSPRWVEIVQSLTTLGEKINLIPSTPSRSGAFATNIDVITSGIWFFTSPAVSNFVFNIQGNADVKLNDITSIGQAITIVVMTVNASVAFYNTQLQIDSANVGVRWQNSTVSSGNANALDSYSYTLIKTGSGQFSVLASQTKFA